MFHHQLSMLFFYFGVLLNASLILYVLFLIIKPSSRTKRQRILRKKALAALRNKKTKEASSQKTYTKAINKSPKRP